MGNNQRHKCYISFKTEDECYKKFIQEKLDVNMIDKSLNSPIDSDDEDYIMRVIREKYLSDSTVTIFLIGEYSSESLGWREQRYIKRELQASLYNAQENSRNGILGIVLPKMIDKVYRGTYLCDVCGGEHRNVQINESTVIREFSYNYYLPSPSSGCSWSYDDRYCVLATWDEFRKNPEKFIDDAYQKRNSEISKKVKVRP